MAFTTSSISQTYDISSQGSMLIGGEELGGFKSGSITLEGETVENFARGDGGWTYTAPGKRSVSVEVTFLKKTDACQDGLRGLAVDADYQNKGVAIVYSSTTGGFSGTFVLTNYSESQTDGGDAVECTASFASFGAVTVASAPSNS